MNKRQLIPIIHSADQSCRVDLNVADAVAASEILLLDTLSERAHRVGEQLLAAANAEMAGSQPVVSRQAECMMCDLPARAGELTCGSIRCRTHDSPAPTSSGPAEERDAAGTSPTTLPAASRSGCTQPSNAELRAVAETLRSLAAAGRPNADTAPALARVGDWLRDLASAEIEKGKAA